jgi:hypothetical protein
VCVCRQDEAAAAAADAAKAPRHRVAKPPPPPLPFADNTVVPPLPMGKAALLATCARVAAAAKAASEAAVGRGVGRGVEAARGGAGVGERGEAAAEAAGRRGGDGEGKDAKYAGLFQNKKGEKSSALKKEEEVLRRALQKEAGGRSRGAEGGEEEEEEEEEDEAAILARQMEGSRLQQEEDAIAGAKADGARVMLGLVGHPNVGKVLPQPSIVRPCPWWVKNVNGDTGGGVACIQSSVLNTLVGRKAVSVKNTPGHTKILQTYILDDAACLIDSPGVVFPRADVPLEAQVKRSSWVTLGALAG